MSTPPGFYKETYTHWVFKTERILSGIFLASRCLGMARNDDYLKASGWARHDKLFVLFRF